MPFRDRLLFLCLVLLSSTTFAALTFTSPIFEKLNVVEMEAQYKELQKRATLNSVEILDRALFELFLAEAYADLGWIHQSAQVYTRLDERCLLFEEQKFAGFETDELRGKAAYACALLHVELIHTDFAPLQFRRAQRIQNDFNFGLEKDHDPTDKLYAEGRLFFALPPAFGLNEGRSLVALQFLTRLRPELSSIDFWIARAFQTQGDLDHAREYFQKATARTPPDVRTHFFYQDARFRHLKEHTDGLEFGVWPGIFVSATEGVGAQLAIRDDRISDTLRSVSAKLTASTRGNVGAHIRYQDGEILSDQLFQFSGSVTQGVEDFYGLGINSNLSDQSQLTYQRAMLSIAVVESFLHQFYFRLGWGASQMRLKNVDGGIFPSLSLPDSDSSFHTGAFAELGFDSLDSAWEPQTGTLVRVKGYFPNSGLGSQRTFSELTFEGQQYWRLARRHQLAIKAATRILSGDVPFSVYSKLGGSFPLPGIRIGRFQDKQMYLLTSEYLGSLGGPFSLALFTSLGTVSPDTGSLFQVPMRAGFGTGLQMQVSKYRSDHFRLEIGYFANETIVQIFGGKSF